MGRLQSLTIGSAFLILVLTVLAGIGEPLHARLLLLGNAFWADYTELRQPLVQPTCDPNQDIEKAVTELANAATENDDDWFDLIEPEPFNPEAARRSLSASLQQCQKAVEKYQQLSAQQTLLVRAYAGVEQGLASTVVELYGQQKILLMLLIWLCVSLTSVTSHHISFRKTRNAAEYRLSHASQLVANGLLLFSGFRYRWEVTHSGGELQQPVLMWIVLACLTGLCCVNLYGIAKSRALFQRFVAEHSSEGGLSPRSLLVVPLYVIMAVASMAYFTLAEQHASGLAIFFSQLLEEAGIFLKVGLYIWLGMLVKASHLGPRVFEMIRSLQLSPMLVVLVVLLLMAYPTAYTGASGIVILALGGLIYAELMRSGVRHSLAMATTAMSGSMGVVLSPCLLVVLIAALNKEVVTTELYAWGKWVFLGSVVVFGLVLWLLHCLKLTQGVPDAEHQPDKEHQRRPGWQGKRPEAIKALLPYVIIMGVGVWLFSAVLNMSLDEMSAPFILPLIFLGILAYEAYEALQSNKQIKHSGSIESATTANTSNTGLSQHAFMAMREGSVHIGALIMLMSLTFAVGGVLERSDWLSVIPLEWSSVYAVMGVCVLVLVILGMIMEPFGAIVLVTTTIAPIAYQNGIDPVHFWMVALVAFELGYLSPPVALNHLLTRQVVDTAEIHHHSVTVSGSGAQAFWLRHERFLLPMAVLGVTLMVVAFVPLRF